MINGNVLLAIAIAAEIVATTALKATNGLTRPIFVIAAVIGYVISFAALSLALRTIPLGIAYAIWSGIGVVMIAVVGRILYAQLLDAPAVVGIALILGGVVCINLWSNTAV